MVRVSPRAAERGSASPTSRRSRQSGDKSRHSKILAAGCQCIFSSDWNEKAQITCEANFHERPHGDIYSVADNAIPPHHILCAGLLIGTLALPLKAVATPVFGVLFWLAISTAMHSFPSTGDAKSIWQAVWGPDAPFLAKVMGTPLVGLIYLGAIGSVFWLDLIYGVAVVVFIPEWLYAHR